MTVEFLLEDLSLVSKENSEITSPCIYCISQVFPSGTIGKESTCQFRRHKRCRFDTWAGKIL